MAEKTVFGIDLGTTYSCVSWINAKNDQAEIIEDMASGDRLTPSVVYYEDTGDPEAPNVVVGKPAKQHAKVEPDRVISVVKKFMHAPAKKFEIDGVDHNPISVSSEILKHLAAQASAKLGTEVKDVVITVPAYFGSFERDNTVKAGELAGLNVVDILPEPMAAALHYGIDEDTNETVLVYDLGGGTFDVTIMSFEENMKKRSIATRGDHDLGGYDWDMGLAEHWTEQIAELAGVDIAEVKADPQAQASLMLAAEEAKKSLSGGMKSVSAVPIYDGVPYPVEVDAETFDNLTSGLLGRTISLVDEAVEIAKQAEPGLHISKVMMVGGSSLMRQVKSKLSDRFGPDVELMLRDPHYSVAFGAAQYALQSQNRAELIEFVKIETARYGAEPIDLGETPIEALDPEVLKTIEKITGKSPEALGTVIEAQFIDVAPKSFGIRHMAQDGVTEVVTNLIRAQQEMPAKGTRLFGTLEDDQAAVRLVCVENERDAGMEDVPYPYDEAERIGDALIELDPGLKKGSGIEVTIEFTSTGRVKLYGRDVVNGRETSGDFAANADHDGDYRPKLSS